jgi:hypothetical protein
VGEENSIYLEVVAAIRAFTCATVSEAEAAADAIIVLFDDPPKPPREHMPLMRWCRGDF